MRRFHGGFVDDFTLVTAPRGLNDRRWTRRPSAVSRAHSLNLSTSRLDFEPQNALSLSMPPAGTVTVKSLAASMIPKVCRLDRTATMMIGFFQTIPKGGPTDGHGVARILDFTVKKTPALILLTPHPRQRSCKPRLSYQAPFVVREMLPYFPLSSRPPRGQYIRSLRACN